MVTDPPYASLEKHRAIGTTTRLKKSKGSSNAWFPVIENNRLPELMARLWRVLRCNSHLFMFADEETAYLLKPLGEQVGFTAWTSLTWVKTRTSMPEALPARPEEVAARMLHQGMGYHYRCTTERILFFEKGKRKLYDLGVPNVLFGPRAGKDDYPTQKPLSVVETLVMNSSAPGELVLDPFCGSGTVGLAARNLGRRALLMDVDTSAANQRVTTR